MQTRQLIAGDTLLLEEEKSFCLVVDGLVQVFVKSPQRRPSLPDDDDEEWEGGQGYQLLTEAKNGGIFCLSRQSNNSTIIKLILYSCSIH
jgi:lysophospholipid hydrolase